MFSADTVLNVASLHGVIGIVLSVGKRRMDDSSPSPISLPIGYVETATYKSAPATLMLERNRTEGRRGLLPLTIRFAVTSA
jgi:hypothetical protein